jgi:PKD repeat protein
MKTIKKIKNQMISKITKVAFLGAFICIGFTSKAQCTASFVPFDSVGYGYFWNTSIGSGLTSTWNFGDGSTGTSVGDITHLYASPGTYYVCLTVNNFTTTCTATFCDSITIAPSSTGACMGIVNASFTESETAGTINFTNVPSGSSPVYFWDFGDGTNSSVAGSTSHTYATNGTYPVCLTVYETGSGTDSCQYCTNVTVTGASPACSLTMNVVQDSSNLFNYFVYYTASTPGATTYLWDFGDGTASTLPYPSHTYLTTSPVVVCLTISDGLLCTVTSCDSITPGLMMSSTFTINAVNPLGISENENAITSLDNYPNPFSDFTTINYVINKEAHVSMNVIDLLGNTIAELENGNKASGEYTATWNPENIAEGMYLLQLKVNNNISTKKIIVNK